MLQEIIFGFSAWFSHYCSMFHENVWFTRRILFQKGFSLRKLWQKLSIFYIPLFLFVYLPTSQKHIFHIFTAKCCLSLMQKCNSLSKHGKPVRRKLMYSLYSTQSPYNKVLWWALFMKPNLRFGLIKLGWLTVFFNLKGLVRPSTFILLQ